MPQKPETRFRSNSVLPFLKTLRHTFFMAIQQVAICGDPDFVLCVAGRFVALELKARGGRLSKLQEYKLGEVTRTHGVSIVAHPDNWEEVKYLLSELDQQETAWNHQI